MKKGRADWPLTRSDPARTWLRTGLRLGWRALWARVTARLGDSDMMRVPARGTVFLIRVASALLAMDSQVLFARWMGGSVGLRLCCGTGMRLIGQALDLWARDCSAASFGIRERTRGSSARIIVFGSRVWRLRLPCWCGLCAGMVRCCSPWLDDLHGHSPTTRLRGAGPHTRFERAGRISRSYDGSRRDRPITVCGSCCYTHSWRLPMAGLPLTMPITAWCSPAWHGGCATSAVVTQAKARCLKSRRGRAPSDVRPGSDTALRSCWRRAIYLMLAHTDV